MCVSINFQLNGLIRKKTNTPPTRGTTGIRGHKIAADFQEAEWDEKKTMHKKTPG